MATMKNAPNRGVFHFWIKNGREPRAPSVIRMANPNCFSSLPFSLLFSLAAY
jgi:hypothetical protein